MPPGSHGIEPYALVGYDRRRPLLEVVIVFSVLLLAIARLRGLLALGGLLLSLVLMTKFMVPRARQPPPV